MIRRLILAAPVTEGEAAAATQAAAKIGAAILISYRPSASTRRLLMFDAVSLPGKKRRDRSRLLDAPEQPAWDALAAAMAARKTVFNVFTAYRPNPGIAYSSTDAVFTVAFPEGDAVAWFSRVGGGIAPGIVSWCLGRSGASLELKNAARYLFFKRPPAGLRQCEAMVSDFARGLLADVPRFS